MTRSRRFFASSPWIATGTPDYVNLGYTSRGLAKQALMRLSRKSLAIFRKLGLVVAKFREREVRDTLAKPCLGTAVDRGPFGELEACLTEIRKPNANGS